MPRNRYKAKEKKVYKMTRSGLVERNTVTADEKSVSKREKDFALHRDKPNSQEKNIKPDRNPEKKDKVNIRYRREQYMKYQESANETVSDSLPGTDKNVSPEEIPHEASDNILNEHEALSEDESAVPENIPKKTTETAKQTKSDTKKSPLAKTDKNTKNPEISSKLNFTDNENPLSDAPSPDRKLSRLQKNSDKVHNKLENAREKLPSKKHIKITRTFDEAKNKPKARLQFEKETLPPDSKKLTAPVATVKKGTDTIIRIGAEKLHQKVYEVENENVGIKAGHRVEQAAESVYRSGKRTTRSAFRYVRNKPYRTVEKLEKKAVKADINLSYRKSLNDNPQLKSNVVSRFIQKRKIKQQYAKSAREAKRTGSAVKKTGNMTANAVKAVAGAVKSHPAVAVIIIIILLLMFFTASLVSSFGSMVGAGLPTLIASSYLAEDSDIDMAELSYTEWETDLRMQIENMEQSYPGYDEYRYQIDSIEHDPYELTAFLTAVYQDYKYSDIENILRQIFDEQYNLSVVESTETRYADPTDADGNGDYEAYEWRILTVTLTSQSFNDVIISLMNDEQREHFEMLVQSKGNRQYIGSPLGFNWLPYITSQYGYRIHPISGEKDFHKGVDIAVPTGTEIHAAHDGKVTFAGYHDSYGYLIVIEDDNGLVTKYAHCDSLSVSAGQQVKRGDAIALSGNTGDSTGPHLHFEIINNGEYQNPIYFSGISA